MPLEVLTCRQKDAQTCCTRQATKQPRTLKVHIWHMLKLHTQAANAAALPTRQHRVMYQIRKQDLE